MGCGDGPCCFRGHSQNVGCLPLLPGTLTTVHFRDQTSSAKDQLHREHCRGRMRKTLQSQWRQLGLLPGARRLTQTRWVRNNRPAWPHTPTHKGNRVELPMQALAARRRRDCNKGSKARMQPGGHAPVLKLIVLRSPRRPIQGIAFFLKQSRDPSLHFVPLRTAPYCFGGGRQQSQRLSTAPSLRRGEAFRIECFALTPAKASP